MEEIARVIALKRDIMNMNMTSSSKRIHSPASIFLGTRVISRVCDKTIGFISGITLISSFRFLFASLLSTPPWLHQTRMLSTPQGWRRCSLGHLPIRGHQSTRYRQWEENLLVMVDLWLKSSLLTVVYDSDRSSFWVALFTVFFFQEIAIRVFRTAHELAMHTVAIYSYEDRLSAHRQKVIMGIQLE